MKWNRIWGIGLSEMRKQKRIFKQRGSTAKEHSKTRLSENINSARGQKLCLPSRTVSRYRKHGSFGFWGPGDSCLRAAQWMPAPTLCLSPGWPPPQGGTLRPGCCWGHPPGFCFLRRDKGHWEVRRDERRFYTCSCLFLWAAHEEKMKLR